VLYNGVENDADSPAIIGIFGLARVDMKSIDPTKPAWRRVQLGPSSLLSLSPILVPYADLPRAPGFERAYHDRGRDRRSGEQKLSEQSPINRPKQAEERDQKRNREDERHIRPWRELLCDLDAENAGRMGSFPRGSTGAEIFY
jgi:hypothetical protein